MLEGKNIVLGVCGGIAAYKAADVVSRLKKMAAEVSVIMTKSACELISPATFRALSQNPVSVSVFDEPKTWEINHISLAERADVFLVAPATANVIGKIAGGIADDMLTTSIMASLAPKLIAPAMNTNMFENPIVRENLKKLEGLGYTIIPPRSSRLACGTVGTGALAEAEDIVEAVCAAVMTKDMAGVRILVTAGPTVEDIDPVRFITNHSSGKMGYAIARAAKFRGAEVTLISGPVSIKPPVGVNLINVRSADEMYEAVMENYRDMDIIIKAAAVGDFKPETTAGHKIKKSGGLTVDLVKNRDILKDLGKIKENRVIVGFCMETENLVENAKQKLWAKNADMIVANSLTEPGAGFGTDTNKVVIIDKMGGLSEMPLLSKDAVAGEILSRAFEIMEKKL